MSRPDIQKCLECGVTRDPELHRLDYSPIQAVFGQQFGWYSSDDGEFCGVCLAALMGGRTNDQT